MKSQNLVEQLVLWSAFLLLAVGTTMFLMGVGVGILHASNPPKDLVVAVNTVGFLITTIVGGPIMVKVGLEIMKRT